MVLNYRITIESLDLFIYYYFLFQVSSPNHVIPDCMVGKKSWRLITVPMATPSLNLLREKFSELTRAEPHLGLNPRAPSLEGWGYS